MPMPHAWLRRRLAAWLGSAALLLMSVMAPGLLGGTAWAASAPSVTAAVYSGSTLPGSTLTVTGSNFLSAIPTSTVSAIYLSNSNSSLNQSNSLVLTASNNLEVNSTGATALVPSSVAPVDPTQPVYAAVYTDDYGLSSAVAVTQSSLPPPPTITSISPLYGTAGTTVTITGSGFTNVEQVTVGGSAVSPYVVNVLSSTEIQFPMPPMTQVAGVQVPGYVYIQVETPSGYTANGPQDQFFYTGSQYPPLYVSPSGSDSNTGSAGAPLASINRALSLATPGQLVVLEPGIYHEDVSITQDVTLMADPAASPGSVVIDATGYPNGVVISGLQAAGTNILGLTIENADKAGLVAMNTNNLFIAYNTITNNDKSFQNSSTPQANFTATDSSTVCNLVDDCEALHLIGVRDSSVQDNTVSNNLDGGIYLTDETGVTSGNSIDGNTVENNQVDCGITLASHSGLGVDNNSVESNTVSGNGGAGILLATPSGQVENNSVYFNTVTDNGLGGITLHTHVPGAVVSGNTIEDNVISNNAADMSAGGSITPQDTMGISMIGVVGAAIQNTTISGNKISNEYYGVYQQLTTGTSLNNNVFFPQVTNPVYPPPPAVEVIRTLQPGWNTLSVPFVLASNDNSLSSILADPQALTIAYTYDPTNGWTQVTGPLNTPMQGMYVEVNKATTATFLPTSSVTSPPTYNLQVGWNLVGPSGLASSAPYQIFLANVNPNAVPLLVDPNAPNGGLAVTNPSYDYRDQALDGYAYWIYANAAGQVLLGHIGTPTVNPYLTSSSSGQLG